MSQFACPHCGGMIAAVKPEEGEMKRGLLSCLFGAREFEASGPWEVAQPQPFAPPYERPHVLARYFDLNWRHALASGFLLGLVVALFYMPSAIEGHNKLYTPLIAGFATFALISTIVWGILIFFDRKGLYKLEMATGLDLNRDGHTGEPPDEEWIRSEVTDKDRNQVNLIEFKFPPAALSRVAVAILREGKNFSRRDLSDEVSESQFRYLQQQMLDRGMCHWKDPQHVNLGVDMSPGMRAFLRGYLPK